MGLVVGQVYEVIEYLLTGSVTIIDSDGQNNILFEDEYVVVEY